MDSYELRYLREVMRWLQHSGGKYEPNDFEDIYVDWQTHVQQGLSSALPYQIGAYEFVPPERTDVSTEGASWAMEGR